MARSLASAPTIARAQQRCIFGWVRKSCAPAAPTSVLVFDEATSALDNATEQSVMDSIEGLSQDLTILIIAHRLTTVQHCDVIVELGQGQVVEQGTYGQLCESSPSFRAMTRE